MQVVGYNVFLFILCSFINRFDFGGDDDDDDDDAERTQSKKDLSWMNTVLYVANTARFIVLWINIEENPRHNLNNYHRFMSTLSFEPFYLFMSHFIH